MESKDKVVVNKDYNHPQRDFSIKAIFNVCKYSMEGYINFYRYERSAILHLIVAVVIILGSLSMNLTPVEWLLIIFILLVMLAIELLNTAIEAVCDLVSPSYNKLVKVAKDSASAATFSISIALVIAMCIIYVPKIMTLLGM